MTHAYFDFFNQLRHSNLSVNQFIESYMKFMLSINDDFSCGFFGILDGGNFVPTSVSSNHHDTSIPSTACAPLNQLSLPLLTNDVHQEIYGLDDVIISDAPLNEQFPYIGYSNFQKLDRLIEQAHSNRTHNYVLFNLCYDDYIVACVCLFTSLSLDYLNKNIDFYRFIKNNLELLVNECYLKEDLKASKHINDTARSILDSKRYLSYDKSLVLARLLDLAFELLDEPDYGSALLFENSSWTFVHAIGHDIDRLSKLHLPEELHRFSSEFWTNYQEVGQNIYFIENILETKDSDLSTIHSSTFTQIKEISKPIKQTLQLHLYINNTLIGIISLDKKADSTSSFTHKTINILNQLHYLGQFLLAYSSLALTTHSFEEITDLISRMIVTNTLKQDTFLPLFLKLLVNRLFEVDYASAYIVDSDGVHFLAAVGHDLEGLQKPPLKPHHFVNLHDNRIPLSIIEHLNLPNENSAISIALLTDLMKSAEPLMPEDLYNEFLNASRSIKDGLIAEALLEEGVYMNISVDIANGNELTFSKESIKLFTTLINLGFSFISNQYYINKYQTLNSDLAHTVQKRTKALKDSNRKLRDIAKKDSLTGLLNHKYIIARLTKLIAYNKPLSIFLFDIDHFKIVNDLYGHQVGDVVLLKISQLIQLEKKIIAGRYGGEEFLLLMPEMSLKEATLYCQNLLQRIELAPLIKGHTITISGGVVTHKKGTSTEIIQAADAYLYKAKNSGRNRIESGYC